VTFQGDTGKNFYVVLSGRFKVYERASTLSFGDSDNGVASIGTEVASLSEGDSFGDKVFEFEENETVRRATVVCAQHGSETAVISEDDYKLHFMSHSDHICFVPKHAIEVFKKECVHGLLASRSERGCELKGLRVLGFLRQCS
jgi:Cyclic nucleotide-binding domain